MGNNVTNRLWDKLSAIPGPGALDRTQKMIEGGEFTKDELTLAVATAAMFPVAIAEAHHLLHKGKSQ